MSPDKLDELRTLIPDLGPAVDRRAVGERLTQLTQALRDAPAEFARLDALLDLAAWLELPRDLVENLEDAASDLATALRTAQTPQDLRTAQERYSTLHSEMGRLTGQISRYWQARVNRDFRPMISFGVLLTRVDTLADLGQRLQRCGQAAIDSTAPSKPDDLKAAITRLNAEAESLQTERAQKLGAVPGVGDFLSAIGAQNATLAVVTKEVLEWLADNGGLEHFKVSI
jgi:hypothetical protein